MEKNICAPIKPAFPLNWQQPIRTWVRMVFSHGFHGLMPQTCSSLEKTWVRIVFSHGFHGLRSPKPAFLGKNQFAPGCALCFPMVSWAQKPQTCIYLEKTYIRTWVRIVFNSNRKPAFPLAKSNSELGGGLGWWGVGVVGWWGGGLCISNDLKRTSNEP